MNIDFAEFDSHKSEALSGIDLSRKGSVDEPIKELIQVLNNHKDLFTLSSCSGRIIVFREGKTQDKIVKKGCEWISVSHETVQPANVLKTLNEVIESSTQQKENLGSIVIKFEPFILHVQCRNIKVAKKIHTLGVDSGFRNSGITVGKIKEKTGSLGKIVVAIRSSHGLEVPISNESGKILVSNEYIEFVLGQANDKFAKNVELHDRLLKNFQEIKWESSLPKSKGEKKNFVPKPKVSKETNSNGDILDALDSVFLDQ